LEYSACLSVVREIATFLAKTKQQMAKEAS